METNKIKNFIKAAQLMDELSELTPEDIRNLIASAGIKGKPGNSKDCPLARYVESRLGFTVVIGAVRWRLEGGASDKWSRETPDTVTKFVNMVDGDPGAMTREWIAITDWEYQ